MDKFTEKYRGINVIPMRQSRFYPDWMLITRDGQTQYLSGHAADRLAAYEDTGLTPEEIELMKEAQEIGDNMTPQRLAEILKADRAGRLVVLPEEKARWLKAILDERERQNQKWGFPQENTYGEWGSILAEEAGELCKELNELNFGSGDPGKMETEAVQVAAVALSILEHAAVAHDVTVQVAEALGRLARHEAEAAASLERKEDAT